VICQGDKRRRRHSFGATVREIKGIKKLMSPQRMRVDVELRYNLWLLIQQERKLCVAVDALQKINDAYGRALSIFPRAIEARGKEFETIARKVFNRSNEVSSWNRYHKDQPTDPLGTLEDAKSVLGSSKRSWRDAIQQFEGAEARLTKHLDQGGAKDNLRNTVEMLTGKERIGQRSVGWFYSFVLPLLQREGKIAE